MTEYQSEGFGYAGVDNKSWGTLLAQEALRLHPMKACEIALVWGLKSKSSRGLSIVGMVEVLEAAVVQVDYMEIAFRQPLSITTPKSGGLLPGGGRKKPPSGILAR